MESIPENADSTSALTPPARDAGMFAILVWMQLHGTAIGVDWGEDDGTRWSCAWVSGGTRYVGIGDDPLIACWEALRQAGLIPPTTQRDWIAALDAQTPEHRALSRAIMERVTTVITSYVRRGLTDAEDLKRLLDVLDERLVAIGSRVTTLEAGDQANEVGGPS